MSSVYTATRKLKSVNPGELNKKIQIIRLTDGGRNENGFELPPTETIVRECWAKVSNTSGTESTRNGSDFSNVKKRFLVRYTRTEITTGMVLRYAGKDYDIEYINNYNDEPEFIEIWTSRYERSGYDG